MCSRIGHQIKDCEVLGDLSEEGYEDIDEQRLSYGQWMRVSHILKAFEE